MKVAVVTPTIGAEELEECIYSVQNQTYQNLTHYIFLDGQEHYDKIHPIIYKHSGKRTIKTISIEENIGKGWYGHRVYSACSFLVNADVICYLDEDNWYDPDHVETIVKRLSFGFDWVYSLRKIYDKNGNFLFKDNCESLGQWPVYFDDSVYHIDTSSFAVRNYVAFGVGHFWYGKWGADRQFFAGAKKYFGNFACTGKYTLNYRLDGNDNSVKPEFFEKGNLIHEQKYGSDYPWSKVEDRKVEVVGPGIEILI
jgi:glycosyltransferase involved in cell wall biosynthesis